MLEIRRYRADDRDSIWDLHNIALNAVGAHGGNGPWDDDLRQVEKVYLTSGGEFLVGECDGRLVAMGALKRTNDNRAEIKRMRVRPDYQRRGFGQAILSALERRALELGYTLLHLDTTVQQTAARHLYERNGYVFVRAEDIRNFHCLFYEKRIGNMHQELREVPVFGEKIPGKTYICRPGAYAVIVNEAGLVAVMSTTHGYFLPGGGSHPGELPEDALHREVMEECGGRIRIRRKIGDADEYTYSPVADAFLQIRGAFFEASFLELEVEGGEDRLCWLLPAEAISRLGRQAQSWAVQQAT